MFNDPAFVAAWQPRMLAVLRIVTAYMFLLHGTSKLLGVPHVAMFDNLQLMSMIGLAGIIELVGGVLLLIGAFARPVAFVMSGEMAAAYFIAHASRGTPHLPMMNQGEAAVLYCFIFLYFAVAGAGAWSVDAARGAATSPATSMR
ncbi:MAG TPA: DoxX family protein [Albitalea sp.]|nr:DoxX family protein [Albitalea sp.]